jgi:DNA-binding cell septation regulator SpoVG
MSLSFKATVNLPKNPTQGNFRAFATLIVNDVLYLNGFRVMDGKFGLFAAAPATKSNKQDPETGRNIWYDDIKFIEDVEEGQRRGPVSEAASEAILAAYTAATSSTGGDTRPAPTNERPDTPATSAPRW